MSVECTIIVMDLREITKNNYLIYHALFISILICMNNKVIKKTFRILNNL